MSINYNVTGSDRKRLVSIITHVTGEKGTYEGVPTMAYRVGGFTVDKTGILSWDDTVDNGTVLKVYEEIKAAGFEPEEEPDLRNTRKPRLPPRKAPRPQSRKDWRSACRWMVSTRTALTGCRSWWTARHA